MRRLGSTFVMLWLTFFVPSLIVWGLMLRWSDATADRFESIWRWTADRLAFPLLLERQTDWSWQALSSDSRLDATSRFLLLTALWAIMLALPLALIGGWWMWMTSRGSRATPPSSSASYDSQATLALSKPSSTIHVLRPALATFVITWAAALVIFGIWFAQLEPWEWRDAFVAIRINPRFRLKVKGRCTGFGRGAYHRRRGFPQYELSSRGYRVEKLRNLVFRVASTNVPLPFQVYWKVRNGGDEAHRSNALRGEINEDTGHLCHSESTLYKGTH
jgi:hypothetical protein